MRARPVALPLRRALLGGAVLACAGAALAQGERLRVGGTGAGLAGLPRLLDQGGSAWGRPAGPPSIQLLPEMGSTGGIAALVERHIDLALTNRPPRPEEGGERSLRSIEYARTPFVVAVHQNLGLQALRMPELARLFGDGAALFPHGRRARPILRSPSAGASDMMRGLSPEVAAAYDQALQRRGMLRAATDPEAADLLDRVPGAFAGLTLAQLVLERRPFVALAIDGIAPTLGNLFSGRWAHHRPLYAVVRADGPAAAQRVIDHLGSTAVERELLATGHLPGRPA
jgi:phosphate transport system substrate-binding protein